MQTPSVFGPTGGALPHLLHVNPKNPASLAGALIRVAPDGTRTTVASMGLIAPAERFADPRR